VTTPQPNSLLSVDDFAKFQAKDQQWFLDAVASTIEEFCHWHIAPSVVRTNVVLPVGGKGIVLLPSLYVTSVEALRLNGNVVDPSFYTVHREGWIQFNGFLKPPRNCSVSVDFTHGYTTTPNVVSEVGFELAATVLEKASGVVTDLTRGPTMMKFKEFGIVLSPGQEQRLQPFRLRRV
jgi:hypothetical protein